jgi:hypothetical protein
MQLPARSASDGQSRRWRFGLVNSQLHGVFMIDMNDDTTAMLIILPPTGLLFLALLVGLVLVIRDTVRRRGNWGINTKPVNCPVCSDPAPVVRVPTHWRQALWGGCTCTNCGLDYDKWGRAVDERQLKLLRDEFEDDAYARPRPRQAEADDAIKAPSPISRHKREKL